MWFLRTFTALVTLHSLSPALAQSSFVSDDCKCVGHLASPALHLFILSSENSLASQIPHEPCWPSEAVFQALNSSVDGKLIRGVPPGSVCYSDQPNFDEKKCQSVLDNWLISTFHALDPISIGWPQWAGNPCPPIFPNGTSVNGDTKAGEKGCRLGGYPAYALNATDVTHVQKVVQFVAKHSIRLNVKSTGHSFTGRSTAFGSISWVFKIEQDVRYA